MALDELGFLVGILADDVEHNARKLRKELFRFRYRNRSTASRTASVNAWGRHCPRGLPVPVVVKCDTTTRYWPTADAMSIVRQDPPMARIVECEQIPPSPCGDTISAVRTNPRTSANIRRANTRRARRTPEQLQAMIAGIVQIEESTGRAFPYHVMI
jgi:hypothetical protein